MSDYNKYLFLHEDYEPLMVEIEIMVADYIKWLKTVKGVTSFKPGHISVSKIWLKERNERKRQANIISDDIEDPNPKRIKLEPANEPTKANNTDSTRKRAMETEPSGSGLKKKKFHGSFNFEEMESVCNEVNEENQNVRKPNARKGRKN